MLERTHKRLLWLVVGAAATSAAVAVQSCSSEVPASSPAPLAADLDPQPSSSRTCIDRDNDTFGAYCPSGPDCDDTNPAITDQCYRCNTPNLGCACSGEGQRVDCGEVASRAGNRITCAIGQRVCSGGIWGTCVTSGVTSIEAGQPVRDAGLRLDDINSGITRCVGHECDPYCYQFQPGTPTLDPNVQNTPAGVSLIPQAFVPDSGGGTCSVTTQTAQQYPLGMAMLADRSGSMAGTKWTNVKAASNSFITSPSATGMYAGVTFFPSAQGNTCDGSQYLGPPNGIALGSAALPGNASLITNAISTVAAPNGATPMSFALSGAYSQVSSWLTWANTAGLKGPKGIVVMFTDGLPDEASCNGCDSGKGKSGKNLISCTMSKVANIVDFNYYAKNIELFVIGVTDGTDPGNLIYMNAIARAGSGGQRDAIMVNGTGGQAQAQLLAALNSIRNQALPCDFKISAPPGGGVIDPASANVKLTYHPGGSGNQTTITLPQTNLLSQCGTGDGFIYDSIGLDVSLCPASCDKTKLDLTSSISISYKCYPGCSSVTAQAKPGGIDMLMLIDRSGSMGTYDVAGGAVNRWQAAISSVRNFVGSAQSDGMGFGVAYFPPTADCADCRYCASSILGICTNYVGTPWPNEGLNSGQVGDCDNWNNVSSDCSNAKGGQSGGSPYRYYADYTYGSGSSSCTTPYFRTRMDSVPSVQTGKLAFGTCATPASQCKAVFDSVMAVAPMGGTPTKPALDAAIQYANDKRTAGRQPAVVLLTDGDPNDCGSTGANVAAVAALGLSKWGIRTFVLCIANSQVNNATCNSIANAGSGGPPPTGFNAFVVNNADPSSFINALNAIRQASMSCSFAIPAAPPGGELDYSHPAVMLTANGSPANVFLVSDVTACGSAPNGYGFYYDNPAAPTQIVLCPAPCHAAQSDTTSRVDVVFPCAQRYEAGTAAFEYDLTGFCSGGTTPVWNDWSWDSVTPSDSFIRYTVATGDSAAARGSAVSLQFTRTGPQDLAGYQACGGQPKICDPAITIDTETAIGPLFGGQFGDVSVSQSLKNAVPMQPRNYLRIEAQLNPSGDQRKTPTLRQWGLQIQCKPTQ